MLTIVDRPAIQLVVDEAREAGIEHFIFVTGRNKDAIEDYFDLQFELERRCASATRRPSWRCSPKCCPRPARHASRASSRRLAWPRGLVRARTCRREPFAVILPDMLMMAKPGCLKQ